MLLSSDCAACSDAYLVSLYPQRPPAALCSVRQAAGWPEELPPGCTKLAARRRAAGALPNSTSHRADRGSQALDADGLWGRLKR